MEDDQIISHVNSALKELLEKDNYLLVYDLSEQSISHKLAEHIKPLFPEYDVDCEYNGDITRDGGKKRINLLTADLREHNLLKLSEESDLEREFTSRAVFPDIIIHKRGDIENNLCIIEMKKSTSRVSKAYDELKLKAYTRVNDPRNNLAYQIGIFVMVYTGEENIRYELSYIKDNNNELNPLSR